MFLSVFLQNELKFKKLKKDIIASVFLLDHSLWGKPSAILGGHTRTPAAGSREDLRPRANSFMSASSCGRSLLGKDPPAPVKPPTAVALVDTLAVSPQRTMRLSHPWIPEPQKLCEVMNVYCCLKSLSIGVICYEALDDVVPRLYGENDDNFPELVVMINSWW